MHKATIAAATMRPLSPKKKTFIVLLPTSTFCMWELEKFSGVELKSWEMDEILRGKSRKRLGGRGGVSESSEPFKYLIRKLVSAPPTTDGSTVKLGKRGEKREWEQWNKFCPFEFHPQMLND